jgi:anti-sigma factor RsiW
MSCERMESKILGYVDGRLKESERPDVEKHLAACAPCRVRVAEFRAVSGLLDELPVTEPSAAFDARVYARVAAEPVKQSWWASVKFSPRIALAASMLLLATIWLGFYSQTPTPQLPWNDAKEADVQMMEDLPVLEDHDVLQNFEALKSLPPPVTADDDADTQPQQM